MIKKISLLLACSISLFATAQDTYFNEYNSSKTNLNPAFAGSDSALVASSATHYRSENQFSGDQFQHYFLSIDNYFHFLRGGLAINYNFNNDYGGFEKTNRFSISYAPHFELFQHKLAIQPAIDVGIFSIESKDNFQPYSSNTPGPDQTEVIHLTRKSNMDISAGLLLFSKEIYGGIAVRHLNRPEYSPYIAEVRLPILFSLHAGVNIPLGKFILSPNILYNLQGDYTLLQAGLRAKYRILTFGCDVSSDNIIPEIGLQNRLFKLSYCFSYPTDPHLYNPRGTHEIHFNWFFKHKNKKILSIRMI